MDQELKALPDGFEVDVDFWVMKQHFEWDKATKSVDAVKMAELMAGVIKKWPYKCDPTDVSVYSEILKPKQWKTAMDAVGTASYNCFLG